jgi:hypothetical protein
MDAVNDAVVPICRLAGGGTKKEIEIGIGAVMAMLAETDFVVSATEVAVTVTDAPEGTVAGAVYVIPLKSALVLKVPQSPGVLQVTDQVT